LDEKVKDAQTQLLLAKEALAEEAAKQATIAQNEATEAKRLQAQQAKIDLIETGVGGQHINYIVENLHASKFVRKFKTPEGDLLK